MKRGTIDIVDEATEAFAAYRGLGRDIIDDLIAETLALRKEIDARDAEIARLTEQNHFFQVNYQDEIGISGIKEERDALLAQRDAEIARLKAPAAVWEERLGAAHAEIARLRAHRRC